MEIKTPPRQSQGGVQKPTLKRSPGNGGKYLERLSLSFRFAEIQQSFSDKVRSQR